MITYKLISTFRYLVFSTDVPATFSLMPGVDIITDRKKIKTILNKEFSLVAGAIEHHHFINAGHLIYCEGDETHFKDNAKTALIVWLSWIDLALKDAWLIKDHAITCEMAYARCVNKKTVSWSNNSLQTCPTFSAGHRLDNVTFDHQELIAWEAQTALVRGYLHEAKSDMFRTFVGKGYSRIGRALRFIDAARNELQPPIKISHYCSAFESLFSTDNAELSHKLSERVAIFLRQFSFDPIEVFNNMKSFYAIRSKVTHGDVIKDSEVEKIPALSETCDEYLRRVFNFIFESKELLALFDGNKAEFDEYFKRALLIK